MNRTLATMSKGVLLAGALMMGLLAMPAQAQVQVTIYPPASFRAVHRPVYVDGRAAYLYNGRWYYQERGGWYNYNDEPRQLREYRSTRVVVVPHYERRHHHRRGGGRGR